MSPRVRPDPAQQRQRHLYQERMLRRLFVRHPGWDAGWVGDRKLLADDDSVCYVLGYQPPSVVPDHEIDRHPVVPVADDDTLMQGLARLQVVRREPTRQQEVFGWRTPAPDDLPGWRAFEQAKEAYWSRILAEPLEQMHVLEDTADFKANYALRLLYLHGETTPALRSTIATWRDSGDLGRDVNFSGAVEERLHERFVHFKYWLDEPFAVDDPARPADGTAIQAARQKLVDIPEPRFGSDEVKAEMTYWSENHTVLFATAEYLAGQRWPDNIFRAGALFRSEGPDAVRPGDLTGSQHVLKAGKRLRRWLDDRLRFGFSEWNAPGYYEEDLGALFNLADFALEEDIQVRACMVLDLLLFDLARLSHAGSFGLTAGRAYGGQKFCGYDQTPGDLAQLLFGQRGTYVDRACESAGCFASSTGYAVPPVLVAIAQDRPAALLDRRRVSVDIDEAELHGIGARTEDDVLVWWSRGAYFVKQVVLGTEAVARTRFLGETSPFRDILPMLEAVAVARSADPVMAGGNATGPQGVAGAGDDLSVFTEGSALTQARLTTYRTRHTMLSSVRRFHPHQLNFQSQFCQATLGMGAAVWTTHPSAGSKISAGAAAAGGILGGAAVGAGIGSFFGPIGTAVGGFVGGIAGGIGAGSAAPEGIELFPATGNGPNWWTGSVTVPMTAQHAGAAILAYSPRTIQSVMFGHRTHAWFPKPAFDKGSVVQRLAADTNVWGSIWTFGKAGDGYVALWSARSTQWTTDGPWADRELIADGDGNVFIIQVGDREEFGSYQAFKDEVARARIHVSDLGDEEVQCSYDVPRGERLELHGERDEMRYGGRGVTDHFPRWQTPYVQGGRVGNRTYRYTIAHADRSLHHDFTDLKTNGHAGRRFREIDGPFDDQRDLAFLAIARRGAASVYPENTVAACKHAVGAQGANAVQVDVCLTADGELAVYHDADPEDFSSLLRREGIGDVAAFRPTVPPATGGWLRPVAALTLAELQQNYGYADAAGRPAPDRIPSLRELMAAMASLPTLIHVFLRLRLPQDTPPSQSTAWLRAVESARPAGTDVRTTLLVPDLAVLRAMVRTRAAGSGTPSLCWERRTDELSDGVPPGAVGAAIALGTSVALVTRGGGDGFVDFAATVAGEARSWDAFNFNPARNRGEQIEKLLCQTTNEPIEMTWLVDQEVSGVLTDDVAGLVDAARRAGLPLG